MARLIDLDATFKRLEKEVWWTESEKSAIRQFLNKARKVDAVPVVRCKDCKHFNMQRMECENDYVSTDNEGGADYSINFGPDDFCSYGERKDK